MIRYDSRALTLTEKRYSQPEIESLAVLFGNTKNHMYLYGLPQYTISMDHEPLLPLYNTYKPDMSACIQSHKLATQGYDFELISEPGEDNPTNYMSRHPLQQTASLPAADPELLTHVIVREDLPNALTTEEIRAATATATGKTLQQLISAINKSYIPAENKHLLQPYNLVFTELSTTQDIILHGTWLLIPETLQDKAISLAHEGHMGIVRTKRYLRASVWFPNIDKKVESKIASCMPCQVVTNTNIKEPIKSTALPSAPWTTVNTAVLVWTYSNGRVCLSLSVPLLAISSS